MIQGKFNPLFRKGRRTLGPHLPSLLRNVNLGTHLAEVFVKLHSDVRILTQLQLVGVGVDFVFPREEGRKEGRRRKKEEEPSPSF